MTAGTGRTLSPTQSPTVFENFGYLANNYYSSVTFSDLSIMFCYQFIFMFLFWLIFEFSRDRAKHIFSPRTKWAPAKVPAERPKSWFAWIPSILAIDGEHVRASCGLDTYMMLRFFRMCRRMSLLSATCAVGMIPFYGSRDNNVKGFNRWTLNNLDSDTLWVPAAFMVLFTLHAYYLMHHEYKRFAGFRLSFLAEGSVDDVLSQTKYTVKIEGLPLHLRSDRNLELYLNKLFPEQVFSANVMIDVENLEIIHETRLQVVDKLEKAVAFEAVTGKTARVVISDSLSAWCFCKSRSTDSVDHYRTKLKQLNDEAVQLQEHVHRGQRSADSVSMIAEATAEIAPLFVVIDESEMMQLSTESTCLLGKNIEGDICSFWASSVAVYKAFGSIITTIGSEGLKLMSTLVSDYYTKSDNSDVNKSSHFDRASSTAFATFTSLVAVKTACSCYLRNDSDFLCSPAADPSDIIWSNVGDHASSTRRRFASVCYFVALVLWSAVVSLLRGADAFFNQIGFPVESPYFRVGIAYIPLMLQLGVLSVVPVFVQHTSVTFERLKTHLKVQEMIFAR